MLILTQTYYLTQFVGLVFPDLLLMSLSVWFFLHLHFLFLNCLKMELPLVTKFPLQSCAQIFPFSISVTCYPDHFLSIQLSLLLTVEPVLATDLTSNSNQPWFHKMSAMQFWDKGHGSFRLPPLTPVWYILYVQNAPHTPTLYKALRSQRSTGSPSPVF